MPLLLYVTGIWVLFVAATQPNLSLLIQTSLGSVKLAVMWKNRLSLGEKELGRRVRKECNKPNKRSWTYEGGQWPGRWSGRHRCNDFQCFNGTGPGKQLDLSTDKFFTTFNVPLWQKAGLPKNVPWKFQITWTINSLGPEAPAFPSRRSCTQIQLPVGPSRKFSLSGRRVCYDPQGLQCQIVSSLR